MNYPEDDQNEINRLHNEFVHHSPRNNDDLIALQDASYELGRKRGHGDLRAELDQCGAMADMLLDREWAEHSGTGEISRKLESAITELHNELSESRQREDALQQRLNEADQRIDELEKSLSAVINTGELSREQHEELETDICSLLEHCKKCSTQVALMPSYKRECLKKLTKDSPEVGS